MNCFEYIIMILHNETKHMAQNFQWGSYENSIHFTVFQW